MQVVDDCTILICCCDCVDNNTWKFGFAMDCLGRISYCFMHIMNCIIRAFRLSRKILLLVTSEDKIWTSIFAVDCLENLVIVLCK